MAVSQIINVIVNSKGAVTVSKQLNAIGDSAKTTTTYLNSMRAVLAAALTFSGVSRITETIDSFTQLQNRLKIISTDMAEVSTRWNQLLDIANNSYTSIDNTVNLYYRVAFAFKSWGESMDEAMKFTESFNKAAILSGSTMQTTSQAIYQFSQALNKGKLDGDEFRSVMEGLPYVSNLLQKSLGITRKELYEWAEQGKISVDRIKQAFDEAADTIESDFAKITPTIAMATQIWSNNWVDFVGKIQTSTGIFSAVARLIILVANNFNILAIALTPVAATMAYMAGRLVVGLLVNGFKDMYAGIARLIPLLAAFNTLLWTNPFVLAATLIVAVVAAIIYFRNELGLTNEVLAAIWMRVVAVFTSIVEYATSLIQPIVDVVKNFIDWEEVLKRVMSAAQLLWSNFIDMLQKVSEVVGATASYLFSQFKPVFEALWELAKTFGELILEISEVYFSLLAKAIEAVLPVFKTLWDFVEPALVKLIGFIADVLTGWKNITAWLSRELGPVIKDVFEGWIVIINGVIKVINALISALRTALALMKSVTGGTSGGGGGGMNYGGQFYAGEFNSGGKFKVGGSGAGRDTTPVAFRANRGERVTVETKKQQRVNDAANQNMVPEVSVPVQVVNVLDPKMMVDALDTDYAEKQIINLFKKNREDIRQVLGVS